MIFWGGDYLVYPQTGNLAVDSGTRLGFSVPDPDAIVAKLNAIDGAVVQPGRETSWGYVAVVRDPDGRKVELYRM